MTNPTHASVKQIENAYLRPSKNNWGVIALLCVIGSVPLLLSCTKILPVNITGQVLLGLYAAVILVPCALFGYWQKRAVVVADDTGLTWRGLGKWHTANWSEITDYYEQLRPKANTTITIVTESAKLNIKSDIWGKAAEFKKAIANKALNAQVRKWGFLGARSEVDWPRTFHYNTTDNRFAIYAMPGLIAVCFGLYAWNIAGGGLPDADFTWVELGSGYNRYFAVWDSPISAHVRFNTASEQYHQTSPTPTYYPQEQRVGF